MIVRANPSISYFMWLRKIIDAHTSQAWDAQSTDTHDREDEELNDLWTEIDDSQKERLWGLSSDLNTLRDRETCVDSDWPPMSEEELRSAQTEAFQTEEWDKLLDYLRRPPRFRPRAMVDFMRGKAWQSMGHPEVALLFFDNAIRLEPGNEHAAVLALECLKASGDWPEILRRSESYVGDPAAAPRLLFATADAFHFYADWSNEQNYYREGIRAVDEGFARMAGSELSAAMLVGAYAIKALCLERLGDIDESLLVLDKAIAQFSGDRFLLAALLAALLAVRGLLRQELGRADALDDFRPAVDHGSELVWPYVELARDALTAGQNRDVVDLAYKGLERVRRDSDRAILFELLAIASAQLQNSETSIRQAFRSALELDPLNDRIRANRELFEHYMASPGAPEPHWKLALTAPRIAIRELYSHLQPAA